MSKKPTKKELVTLRDSSYRVQDVKCCQSCKHISRSLCRKCLAIEVRGKFQLKDVELFGVCDLWEGRKDLANG